MMKNSGHRSLDVWQRSVSYVTRIYEVTKSCPREELYGLVSQMRRSAVSIPSNIAEGSTRASTKEYIRFLHMALASASELEVHLLISRNLEYLNEEAFSELFERREEISKMISGQIRSLKEKL